MSIALYQLCCFSLSHSLALNYHYYYWWYVVIISITITIIAIIITSRVPLRKQAIVFFSECSALHTPATLIQFRLHSDAIDSRLDAKAHKIPVQTTLNQHQPHRVHEFLLSQHFPSVRNDNTYYYRCNGHHTIISLRQSFFSRFAVAPASLQLAFVDRGHHLNNTTNQRVEKPPTTLIRTRVHS